LATEVTKGLVQKAKNGGTPGRAPKSVQAEHEAAALITEQAREGSA
jgi:hypothetical protein